MALENPSQLLPSTLSVLGKDSLTINEVASIVGVNSILVAAPIARELNKASIDYEWSAPLKNAVKDRVVN